MSKGAVQAWLTLLEHLPAKRLVVFTTTESIRKGLFGEFSNPFASRCYVLELSDEGLAGNLARRAKAIAQKEGLDGKPLSEYEALVEEQGCNLRAVLNEIEAGAMVKSGPCRTGAPEDE